MPNVQWRTPDDGQSNCPKHVEILDKNKFGKISASVGFIKKIFLTLIQKTCRINYKCSRPSALSEAWCKFYNVFGFFCVQFAIGTLKGELCCYIEGGGGRVTSYSMYPMYDHVLKRGGV